MPETGSSVSDDVAAVERAPLHDRGRTWIAWGLVALAIGLTAWWGLARPLEPAPEPDQIATAVPTVPPAQVGEVTASAGLPDAQPLTDQVLDDIDSGWALVTFQGSAFGNQGAVALSGPTILYAVSPTGDTYQIANLDHLGADTLAAWNAQRQMALLRFDDGESLRSYDLATGALGPTIDPCDGATALTNGAVLALEDTWRLTTLCFRPAGNDNPVFTSVITVGDRGELLNDRAAVQPAIDFTVISVGESQVVSGYHTAHGDDGEFLQDEYYSELTAYLPNGRVVSLERPADYRFCNAVGPGRDDSVVVHCYSSLQESVWELPLNSSLPTQIIAPHQFPERVREEPIEVTGSCSTDDAVAVQFADVTHGSTQLVVVGGSTAAPTIDELPAVACFGSFEESMLLGGVEGVAWYTPADGTTTVVLRSPTPSQLGLAAHEWVVGVLGEVPQSPAGTPDQGVSIAH